MIGIGGLDSFELAQDFQTATGATFPLLWDEPRAIWDHYDVGSQHTVLILEENGDLVDTWRYWDNDRVLAAL